MSTEQPAAGGPAVGDRAPEFSLPDQNGALVSLGDFRGRTVVLFFYPKDRSAGCTAQVCGFRDSHAAFVAAGAVVIGISDDDVDSHRRFVEDRSLPYRLLSDLGGAVRRRYGVVALGGLLRGRVTFVIDGDGVIRRRFSSLLNVGRHVRDALAMVEALATATPATGS